MKPEPGADASCGDALENMYLYLDCELSAEKRAHIEEHLRDCIPCLEMFEFETELKTVIAKRCKDEVPVHLYERIRTTLRIEIDAVNANGEHADDDEAKSHQGGIPNS